MSDHAPRTPKYRHYKPKNLAVVRIDGRDIYLGRYDSKESKEKYWRIIAEWNLTGTVSAPQATKAPEPAEVQLTVGELILAFWRHAEVYYRRADGTPTGDLENYRHAFAPLRAMFETLPAQDFGPKKLVLVRQRMIDSGLSRGVVNRRVQRIIRLFAYGVENELIPADRHHALKAVKSLARGRSAARETKPVRPVALEYVEAVKLFLSRQLRALIDLQLATGMRSGEVCILRGCDLDMSGKVWVFTPAFHKGAHHDKQRRIYIGPRGQEVIRGWLRSDPQEYLFQPREAEAERHAEQRRNRQSPMTPSQAARRPKRTPKRTPGARYNPRSYAHAIKKACLKAEVPSWHPHQLRHVVASRLEHEFDLEAARTVLGHSSPATTMIYVEADLERARQVMAAVG
jgi:integrase